ncbi:unnamed protein product [Allacma fusca]|uniref:Matrin-type domain-containing protein n=1 Tax=Allacma fusca TaxID=39272 RepID=A0A8J2K6F6_9HEXA|nr:unnamed protein product [Allacma fusca]
MTEYWKSQEKTFCDICKCWLTDNKSSVDFHKNGKRHKENVEKRLKDIQRKNKSDEKRDKRFELDMQRIEKAALAACEKESGSTGGANTQEKLLNLPSVSSKISTKDSDKVDNSSLDEPRIIHRKEKKKLPTSEPAVSATSTSGGTIGAWKAVTKPEFEDLELPQTNRIIYEPKQPEKRKIEFSQKVVSSLDTNTSSLNHSWIKVEPTTVAFKKRKSSKPNMRQRNDDD